MRQLAMIVIMAQMGYVPAEPVFDFPMLSLHSGIGSDLVSGQSRHGRWWRLIGPIRQASERSLITIVGRGDCDLWWVTSLSIYSYCTKAKELFATIIMSWPDLSSSDTIGKRPCGNSRKDGQVTFCIRLKQDLLRPLKSYGSSWPRRFCWIAKICDRADAILTDLENQEEATLPASRTDSVSEQMSLFVEETENPALTNSETWTSTIWLLEVMAAVAELRRRSCKNKGRTVMPQVCSFISRFAEQTAIDFWMLR